MNEGESLQGMIESFLFIAGDEGLTIKQLTIVNEQSEVTIRQALTSLLENYEGQVERGITLKQFGGSYRLVTKPEFADSIKRLLENPLPLSITKSSLEVLAILAYKQPVTRVEIDDLRGFTSEGPIHTLIPRVLIMKIGISKGNWRAILYDTTKLFLMRFGLESLEVL